MNNEYEAELIRTFHMKMCYPPRVCTVDRYCTDCVAFIQEYKGTSCTIVQFAYVIRRLRISGVK